MALLTHTQRCAFRAAGIACADAGRAVGDDTDRARAEQPVRFPAGSARAGPGYVSAAPAATGLAPAVLSSGGLQPASLRSVVREFGQSSPFLAQWIDQSGVASSLADDRIQFLPSTAGIPIEVPPMLSLARLGVQRRAEPATPALMPAANIFASANPQPIPLPNVENARAEASVPRLPEKAAALILSVATAFPAASDSLNMETLRRRRTLQSATAYLQTSARLGAARPDKAPSADFGLNEALDEAIGALA